VHTAPLLEEKWDLGPQALIPNLRDPFLHDWQPSTYKLKEIINFLSAINDGAHV